MTTYHPAFETLSEFPVPEYRAGGVYLRHRETGCEVFHLRSEDEENTFAFCFRTPSSDGTGVAHIVEHSVLCGSERFPVKDAFISLARGTLATFLNAFTYPDKTVYPAASTVEADYFNLLDVYGDAVFRPRITRETFLQEAHHLEYGEDGKLERKGVVYNEMRGDYSSPDSLIATRTYQTLFSPGHPYHADSGGDPDEIPSLTYEAFRAFWESRYHPSNCRIFLHGSIPTGRQLAFLEDRFLSGYSRREPDSEIPFQPRFESPVRVSFPFPAEEGTEARTTTLVSWLTVPPEESVDNLTLEVLGEVLLGSDGAPLAQALTESGLGEDLSPHSGLNTGLRQALFSAGLRGVERGREAEIEDLILRTLGSLVRDGIPGDLLDAAFHSIEFSSREIRRGGGTYGLRLLSRSLRGWLHGKPPELTLSFETPLAELKARMAEHPRYLEERLREWILDKPHRVTVTVYPDTTLAETQRTERRTALDALERGLSDSDRAGIREIARALRESQDSPDGRGARDSIPMLKRSDIPREIEVIPRQAASLDGTPASLHPVFTNGIVYADFAFPLADLPEASLPFLPLLARFVSGAGLPDRSYAEVSRELARKAGGFHALLQASTQADGALESPSAWIVFRLKALERKFPAALDLARGLMTEPDFGDKKRLSDLLAELANDVTSAIVPSGSSFAASRAAAGFSGAQRVEELWRGLSQFLFLSELRDGVDADTLAGGLSVLLRSLVGRKGMRVNLTADPKALDAARAAVEAALAGIPPTPGSPPAAAAGADDRAAVPERFEAWSLPAQVGFSAVSLRSSPIGTPGFAHELALGHLLSTGYLWDEVRVKGGAYGASAWTDGSESTFSFSSYRDPAPNASLKAYRASLEAAAADGLPSDTLERAVVGAAGRDLRPMMPEEKGFIDFKRELFGITDDMRRRKRADLLSLGARDLREAAVRLLDGWEGRAEVLISHGDDIESMKRENPALSVRQLQL